MIVQFYFVNEIFAYCIVTFLTLGTADEKKLIDAMKRGAEMSVTGTSSRGTLTRDNYSLAGISAALDKVAATCK